MTIASLFASNCSFGLLHSTLHFVQTYRLHLRSSRSLCTYCMRWYVAMLTRASSGRAVEWPMLEVSALRRALHGELKLPRHACRNNLEATDRD